MIAAALFITEESRNTDTNIAPPSLPLPSWHVLEELLVKGQVLFCYNTGGHLCRPALLPYLCITRLPRNYYHNTLCFKIKPVT